MSYILTNFERLRIGTLSTLNPKQSLRKSDDAIRPCLGKLKRQTKDNEEYQSEDAQSSNKDRRDTFGYHKKWTEELVFQIEQKLRKNMVL